MQEFYALSREQRGQFLIEQGFSPKVKAEQSFVFPSQFSKEKYQVIKQSDNWLCSCKDHSCRGVQCKHIFAIKHWLDLRQYLTNEGIFEGSESILPTCIYCNSIKVVRFGKRKNKQRLKCEACNKTFVANPEFRGISVEPKAVVLCLDLYFKGLSLRKIRSTLKQFYETTVNHETIRRWKNRFMKKINSYLENKKPFLYSGWHTDEMKVKSKKEWLWIWNTIDEETRYLLASTVSQGRHRWEARQHFKEIKDNRTGFRPPSVTTDGLKSYPKALKKEMFVGKKKRNRGTEHVVSKGFFHNQLIERHQGTQKERLKVFRGLPDKDSVERHAKDYRTFYNFVRENQALKGQTPNEKTEVVELGTNKWLSLIKKSTTFRQKGDLNECQPKI